MVTNNLAPANLEVKGKEEFLSKGYYVAKGLIPEEVCKKLSRSFQDEVKTHKGELIRVSSKLPEKHYISETGLIVNPVLNSHQIDKELFPGFNENSLEILSNPGLQQLICELIADEPVLIQSGYFESSAGTIPHVDSYLYDSVDGIMIACWIALEDIHPSAGRFYVYPKSHLLSNKGVFSEEIFRMFQEYEKLALEIVQLSQLDKMDPPFSQIADCGRLLKKLIKESGIEPYTPNLKAGDVVFFSAKTLHGSDMPTSSFKARNSLVGHFAPRSKEFVRYGKQISVLEPYSDKNMLIEPSKP